MLGKNTVIFKVLSVIYFQNMCFVTFDGFGIAVQVFSY